MSNLDYSAAIKREAMEAPWNVPPGYHIGIDWGCDAARKPGFRERCMIYDIDAKKTAYDPGSGPEMMPQAAWTAADAWLLAERQAMGLACRKCGTTIGDGSRYSRQGRTCLCVACGRAAMGWRPSSVDLKQ